MGEDGQLYDSSGALIQGGQYVFIEGRHTGSYVARLGVKHGCVGYDPMNVKQVKNPDGWEESIRNHPSFTGKVWPFVNSNGFIHPEWHVLWSDVMRNNESRVLVSVIPEKTAAELGYEVDA